MSTSFQDGGQQHISHSRSAKRDRIPFCLVFPNSNFSCGVCIFSKLVVWSYPMPNHRNPFHPKRKDLPLTDRSLVYPSHSAMTCTVVFPRKTFSPGYPTNFFGGVLRALASSPLFHWMTCRPDSSWYLTCWSSAPIYRTPVILSAISPNRGWRNPSPNGSRMPRCRTISSV